MRKKSQDVHNYEANVQSCKNEVSLVQEEVKQKMENVGLLESEVQDSAQEFVGFFCSKTGST